MTDKDARIYFTLTEILSDPEIIKPPRVIIPGLAWEKRITLLAAREKAGKSTTLGAAVAAASKGEPFLGKETSPTTTLWVSLEEHMSEIARRFTLFEADGDRVLIANNAHTNTFKTVEEICEEANPDVIVWDTLGAVANAVSPIPIEPGDSAAWTRIMQRIVTLSRGHASSVILHHARKSDGRYRDSTAIGANVDVLLEMFGEGSSDRTIKGVGRWDIPDIHMRFDGNTFTRVSTKKDVENEVLRHVIANPGCSLRDIRDAVKGRNETIRDAIKRLRRDGKINVQEIGGSNLHTAVAIF